MKLELGCFSSISAKWLDDNAVFGTQLDLTNQSSSLVFGKCLILPDFSGGRVREGSMGRRSEKVIENKWLFVRMRILSGFRFLEREIFRGVYGSVSAWAAALPRVGGVTEEGKGMKSATAAAVAGRGARGSPVEGAKHSAR